MRTGLISMAAALVLAAQDRKLLPKPGLYPSLTEPPCSYASTQNRKGMIRSDDRVIAWLRVQ